MQSRMNPHRTQHSLGLILNALHSSHRDERGFLLIPVALNAFEVHTKCRSSQEHPLRKGDADAHTNPGEAGGMRRMKRSGLAQTDQQSRRGHKEDAAGDVSKQRHKGREEQ